MPSHADRVRRNYPEGVPSFGAEIGSRLFNRCAHCALPIVIDKVERFGTVVFDGVRHMGTYYLHDFCVLPWDRQVQATRGREQVETPVPPVGAAPAEVSTSPPAVSHPQQAVDIDTLIEQAKAQVRAERPQDQYGFCLDRNCLLCHPNG